MSELALGPGSPAVAPKARTSGLRVAMVIWRREMVRFGRQPMRVIAAIGTPLIIWLILSAGLAGRMDETPSGGDASYAAFLLPGMMTLVAVFSAVFSSISVIEDRREGWLQAALVSPAPRWSIALGKILGGASVAWAQASVLLLAAPMLDLHPSAAAIPATLLGLALTSFALAAMGLAFAWRSRTTASFHAVMNLVFFPAWVLSGALFPPGGAADWLAWLVAINPLAWCTEAIRAPLLGRAWEGWMIASALLAIAAMGVATIIVSLRSKTLR